MWTETSTKCKSWHYLIKELGLDRVAKLTPCKKKLTSIVRNSSHEARGQEVQLQRQGVGSVPPETWL
jgi:hypothetical protein